MIVLKGIRPFDRFGNIGMKVPITKADITNGGVGKIVEDLKKVEDTERTPHPTWP